MAKITVRGLRQTKVMRKTAARYRKKTGRRPSDKQIAYWGRGYARKTRREIVIVEEPIIEEVPIWRHTVNWGYGYLNNIRVPSGREVFYSQGTDPHAVSSRQEYIDRAIDYNEIGYRNRGLGWGERAPIGYALERQN